MGRTAPKTPSEVPDGHPAPGGGQCWGFPTSHGEQRLVCDGPRNWHLLVPELFSSGPGFRPGVQHLAIKASAQALRGAIVGMSRTRPATARLEGRGAGPDRHLLLPSAPASVHSRLFWLLLPIDVARLRFLLMLVAPGGHLCKGVVSVGQGVDSAVSISGSRFLLMFSC